MYQDVSEVVQCGVPGSEGVWRYDNDSLCQSEDERGEVHVGGWELGRRSCEARSTAKVCCVM